MHGFLASSNNGMRTYSKLTHYPYRLSPPSPRHPPNTRPALQVSTAHTSTSNTTVNITMTSQSFHIVSIIATRMRGVSLLEPIRATNIVTFGMTVIAITQ